MGGEEGESSERGREAGEGELVHTRRRGLSVSCSHSPLYSLETGSLADLDPGRQPASSGILPSSHATDRPGLTDKCATVPRFLHGC